MGCCFSKELNPNLLSERTSLLQTSVTESCPGQEVKKYFSVSELAEEERPAYGQTNRGVDDRRDASSTDPSARLGSPDGTRAWDEFKDDSRNKSPGDVSIDSDGQAETETAVWNSVKRRIAENAVKRANWFCEVDLSRHADLTPFIPQCENTTATDAPRPSGHRGRPTCASGAVSPELRLTQKQHQDHGHAKSCINQKSDIFFTTKHLNDLLDSDEKISDFLASDCSVKRRTQSFYSICSIDADDLGVERDPSAMTLPAAFDHTDLLTNNETLTGTKETQEGGVMVSEDLPAETQKQNAEHAALVLPDIIGTFLDADQNDASEKRVSVPPEVSMMEKSKMHGCRSHVAGFLSTVDETIPDLLERNDRFGESVLDDTDTDSSCRMHANIHPEFIRFSALEMRESACEVHRSETAEHVVEPDESICSHAEREATPIEAEAVSESNSLQSSTSSTSDISEGSGAVLQPQTFHTGLVDYLGFDACLLLTRHDAGQKEINFGVEDITCHISSTELSGEAPDSGIADERVETSENSMLINSGADHKEPLEADQSSAKDFSENSMSLTWMEQVFSPSPPVASSDADFSVHTSLLEGASQNPEDLKIGEEQMFPATNQESFKVKEEDRCCLQENGMLVKAECFDEHTLKGPDQISSIGHVKTPEMELQNSKSADFDLTLGRNNDERVIHLFLEGSSENAAPSHHAEPPDPLESATLSKNSIHFQCAHVPTYTLLGKADMPSSSDPSNQEPELTLGDVQDVQMVSTAEQQVEIGYRVPLGRTVRPMFEIGEPAHALEGHDGADEGVECFVTSRLQGYQLADGLHASSPSCDLGAAGICTVPDFCADNKAIPLPVEPDQVDLYASMPSYEIHFLGPNTVSVPVQVENPQSLTSTNESERERGVLNMVSELLGKSEVNEDGDCSHFLSLWGAEPELESAWQCRLSEEELMGQNVQEEGKADSTGDRERVQAFAAAYPYSLLVSDAACVWDWQSAYGQLVRLRPCCVA